MKISLDWLGEYIEWSETDPEEVGRRITAHVAEVDEVEQQGRFLEHCCVGKVLSIKKHPDADRLQLCEVDTGKGKKPVVCGGSNLREGMCVAFASVGATVQWHGDDVVTLEKAKIRGEVSEGMICTAEELDIVALYPDSVERVVVDLGDDAPVGTSLREYLGMTDTVLHIDNHAITHRADLFSHIGFARECVAIGLGKWKKDPEFSASGFTDDPIPFKFAVKDASLMPRYCACMISIDGIDAPTPDWMLRRLEATGWRSVNLPVDITNYVMMEVGVPLHSFDADDISGTVTMRAAKKGEKITTLDNSERELSEGAMILEDDQGIFDLLGIMGGLRSSTTEKTRNIYLHSCSLDTVSIRRAMIEMGHRTDAGTTYEKGVSPYVTEQGFYRALELILELLPGATMVSVMDSFGDNGTPEPISVDPHRVSSKLGVSIDMKRQREILESLGFTTQDASDAYTTTPPLWRVGDIEGEHDIVEEVGRIYGYDAVPAQMPLASTEPPERDQRMHAMRDAFKDVGFYELIPLSLVGPQLLERAGFDPSRAQPVQNAIGEELSLMQISTLPRLLEHAESQLRYTDDTLHTFTVANVFANDTDEFSELGMLISAKSDTDLVNDPFLLAKQALTESMWDAGFVPTFVQSTTIPSYAHNGRCADVVCSDTVVGQIFEVHPTVRAHFDLEHRSSAALINMSMLLGIPSTVTVAKPLAQFPAVTYDCTITMDQKKIVEDVLEQIRSSSDLLEEVTIADLYSGGNLEKGQYNLTLRCVYRSAEKTLTEEEVKKEHEKVINEIS